MELEAGGVQNTPLLWIAQHNQTSHHRFPIDRSSSSRRLYPTSQVRSIHKNKTNSTALAKQIVLAQQYSLPPIKPARSQKELPPKNRGPQSHTPIFPPRASASSLTQQTATRRRVPAGPRRSYPSIHVFQRRESFSSSTPVSLAPPTRPPARLYDSDSRAAINRPPFPRSPAPFSTCFNSEFRPNSATRYK